jgi:ketosteroid isomerase-like protein
MGRSDVLRRFYSAFSARDLEALLATLDPEIEFEPALGFLYSRHRYHGHAGMRDWFAEVMNDWEAFESYVETALEDGDRVFALVRLVAHRGELELDAEIGVDCRLRKGKIVSVLGVDPDHLAQELDLRKAS